MQDSSARSSELLLQHAEGLVKVLIHMLQRDGIGGKMANLQAGARFITVPLLLHDDRHIKPVLALGPRIANRTNSKHVIVEMQRKWIAFEFELPQMLWEEYTRADLKPRPGTTVIGVGLGQQRFQVDIDWSMVPHALVAGATRIAGKSTTIESLLVGLMTTLSPDQLKIIIVDPHNDYNRLARAKHLACPIANTPAEAQRAIDSATKVLKFRRAHQIKVGHKACFPVFLVIDEAKNIIHQANRNQQIIELGQEWAKFGGHLIIASQKLTDGDLPGLMINLGWRVVGQVPSKRDATYLSGEPDSFCKDLSGMGDFKIFNGATRRRVQVCKVSTADLEQVAMHPTVLEWDAPTVPPTTINMVPQPGISRQQVGQTTQHQWDIEAPSKGGRPPIQVNPIHVGRYIFATAKGKPVTAKQAERHFGLLRTGHELTRDWAGAITKEIRRLSA